jgi:hypothetical protein
MCGFNNLGASRLLSDGQTEEAMRRDGNRDIRVGIRNVDGHIGVVKGGAGVIITVQQST